jgi:uncharacterized protein YecT (DUF1311 family)
MTAIKLLAALLGLALIGAATARADAAYDACLKTANTNADFSDCGAAYLKRAEAALNAAWKHTYGLADRQTAKDLLAEQRAWIAFKEKSCHFYANGQHGREGQVLSFPTCRGRVIEERTKHLIDIGKDLAPH